MTSKHEERQHAPLPPSASSRWLVCTPSQGYIRKLIASKEIKKRTSGEAAERGTRIHEIGEQLLKWALKGKDGTKAFTKSDPDELREAKDYVEYAMRKIDEVELIYDKHTAGVEDRGILVPEICWGSRDFWIHAGRHLVVCDLKSGVEPVEVKDNTQLAIYAADLVERLDPESVELCVWQPNAADGAQPERRHVYTRREYDVLIKEVRRGTEVAAGWLKKKTGHEGFLVAGDHCEWCDALGVCPAARKRASEISSEKFMPVQIEKVKKLPDVGILNAEQVAEVIKRLPMFEAWADAVKVRALELASKGKKLPGCKVVHKMTRRAWEKSYTDAQIAKGVGINVKELTKTVRLTPKQVEDKLDAARKRKLKKFVFKPEGDPTVVLESDRRAPLLATKINFQPVSRQEEND